VPAVCNRRLPEAAFRGTSEQSTANAAAPSRRHGARDGKRGRWGSFNLPLPDLTCPQLPPSPPPPYLGSYLTPRTPSQLSTFNSQLIPTL